jgi:hypothetical protein
VKITQSLAGRLSNATISLGGLLKNNFKILNNVLREYITQVSKQELEVPVPTLVDA